MASYMPGTTGQETMLFEQPNQRMAPQAALMGMMGQRMQPQGLYGGINQAMANFQGRPQSLAGMNQGDPYFAGRVKPDAAGPMGGNLSARAGQPFNPMGFMQSQAPPNMQQLFGAFMPQGPRRTAPMQQPPAPQAPTGVSGDPMSGLLGGGMGQMNPQILQAIMALFGGNRMGR